MLIALVASLLACSPQPNEVFDRMVGAERSQTEIAFDLTVSSKLEGVRKSAIYQFDYDYPKRVRLTVQELDEKGAARLHRDYLLEGGALSGVDYLRKEHLRRIVIPGSDLLSTLWENIGGLDDGVKALSQPEAMTQFLTPFRQLHDWLVQSEGARTRVYRSAREEARFSRALFVAGPQGRLERLRLATEAGHLEWRVAYRPLRPLRLDVPSEAVKVGSFSEPESGEKFDSEAARVVADRSVRAFANLDNVEMDIQFDGNRGRVWVAGGRIRVKAQNHEWVFDGKNLVARISGKAYRTAAKREQVPELLQSLEIETLPPVFQLLTARNPVKMFVDDAKSIRVAGSLTLSGQTCTLLELKGEHRLSTLAVRDIDGLPASITLSLWDRVGRRALRSEQTYEYLSTGKPLPADSFQLGIPTGAVPSPFPEKPTR